MPTLRLNEKSLAEIQAPSRCRQSYYWDTELSGFGVVVGRTGSKTFVARAWLNGRNCRVTIGTAGRPRPDGYLWNVALARTEAKQILGQLAAGIDPNAERRARREAQPPRVAPQMSEVSLPAATPMQPASDGEPDVAAASTPALSTATPPLAVSIAAGPLAVATAGPLAVATAGPLAVGIAGPLDPSAAGPIAAATAHLLATATAARSEVQPPAVFARLPSTAPTLREGYVAHVERMRKRNRSEDSIATVKKEIEKYLADWLDRPIAELHGVHLVELHDRIKANARPRHGTNPRNARGAPLANRVIAHVSACWNTLNRKHQGSLGVWNPAKAVDRDQLLPKRERISNEDLPDWYARVLKMRNPIQRDGLMFALFTGLRSDEVRSTRFEHVDWTERSLHVPDPKGGPERAFKIPLGDTALEILQRRERDNSRSPLLVDGDGGFAFPGIDNNGRVGPISDLRQRMHYGNKHGRFPVEDVHTLRRTYESVAHEAGISELDLHVLTNHSYASHNVNATYIEQSFAHLASCQATIDAAMTVRISATAARV